MSIIEVHIGAHPVIIRNRASFTFLRFLLITAGAYENQLKKNDSYSAIKIYANYVKASNINWGPYCFIS